MSSGILPLCICTGCGWEGVSFPPCSPGAAVVGTGGQGTVEDTAVCFGCC